MLVEIYRTNNATAMVIQKFSSSNAPSKIAQKIGFIGDGSMAKAICKGIEQKGSTFLIFQLYIL